MRTVWAIRIGALAAIIGGVLAVSSGFTQTESSGEKIVKTTCAQCHRFEGKPESRFNLKAPDLIWAGSKYQRPWLIRWLTGKEAPLYAKGYRWDLTEVPSKHPMVTESEANAIADYFAEHNKDSRVKVGAFDLSKVTKFEAAFGGMAYKAHACLGCHVIEENGKIIGGPQSASLVTAGHRYDQDWLFRFGQNPQDFTPHSGEFLADATEPQLRAVIGFLMVQGVKDFKYYEPWTSPEFGMASVDRGKVLYKEYCSQCHGATGKGDGPAGLRPGPEAGDPCQHSIRQSADRLSLQRDQSRRRGDGEVAEYAVLELDDWSAGRGRRDRLSEGHVQRYA